MDTVDLLAQMSEQQSVNHAALVAVVNNGFTHVANTFSAHALDDAARFAALDQRLAPIEGMRRSLRWAIGMLFVALLTGAADALFNHAAKR